MIISEHLNNFEQGLMSNKKTEDTFDTSHPVYRDLVERVGKVDTRLCKTNLEKTSLYENALKEALQNEYPDKHWSEVTGCNIRTTLLESGNDIDKTARKIVESFKVQEKKPAVKKTTGVLAENMKKKEAKKPVKKSGKKKLTEGVFKNSNGTEYEVIEKGCDKYGTPCMLLKSPKGSLIAAWDAKGDSGEWGQGHYFMDDERGARDYFKKNYSFKCDEACEKKELTEEPVYELSPRYDSRKSFYGKAQVDTGDKGDKNKLYSYGTLVAEIKDGKPVVYDTYSSTTLRHIKDWLRQNGFKAESSKQIIQDYSESLKESAEWKYTLSCSDDLESAIDGGDLEEVVEALKGAYDELVDQELLDEGRRDKVVSALEQIDVYDDGAEAKVEKKLDQFYNVCDKLGVKISFNESLKEGLLTEGKLEIPTVTNNNNDNVRKAIQTVYAQVKDLTDKVNGKLKKVDEKKLDKVKEFCDKKVRNKYYEIFMDAFQIYPVSRKLLLKYLSDGLKSSDSVKAFRQFFESIKQKFYGFAQNINLDSISRYGDGAGEEDMLHNNSRMKQNAGANSKNAIDKYFAKALGFDMDESLKEGVSKKEVIDAIIAD